MVPTLEGQRQTKKMPSITSLDFVAHTATTHITRFIDDATWPRAANVIWWLQKSVMYKLTVHEIKRLVSYLSGHWIERGHAWLREQRTQHNSCSLLANDTSIERGRCSDAGQLLRRGRQRCWPWASTVESPSAATVALPPGRRDDRDFNYYGEMFSKQSRL